MDVIDLVSNSKGKLACETHMEHAFQIAEVRNDLGSVSTARMLLCEWSLNNTGSNAVAIDQ